MVPGSPAGVITRFRGITQAAADVHAPQHDPESAAPMELSHRTCPTGETVVDFGGELDILSAEVAVSYVRDVIDRHQGPVTVNLTGLAFCDAKGLAALVRMARYAEQNGRPFRLASPRPSLVKIMRITGLDRRFLASRASALSLVPNRP
jgi:anti-sigma B factor antagonist